MAHDLPPIAKAARSMLVAVEQAASAFPRRHRYGLGEDLRRNARDLMRGCNRAWRDSAQRLRWTIELQWTIDELKTSLQIGQELKAFRSFGEFDSLIRKAEDIGKQAGAWRRSQQHPNGQNAAPRAAVAARQDTGHAPRPKHHGANQ
jgi:hypothetical protein